MKWNHFFKAFLVWIVLAACGLSFPAINWPEALSQVTPTPSQAPCLSSGDQETINVRLQGFAAEAVLCPGAVFELAAPVRITANNQKIYTQGFPTGEQRAVLRVASAGLATAVHMRDYNDVLLSNLIIDGNRTNLGMRLTEALVYAGGVSNGQIIRDNRIMDPRSWSALHIIEGSPGQPCTNATIENNDIGPAGSSRDMEWADGISFACSNSIVRGNLITDATDGGIVVFGAPGSLIEGNTIRAETRTMLGGINMVDHGAYAGDYTGTVVKDNIIDAAGAVIRIGLGMGSRVWGCEQPNSTMVLTGGTVIGNTLQGEHMQYGYIVDGVREWTVMDNVDIATHSGSPTVQCNGRHASAPAGFQYFPDRAQGVFQPEFASAHLELALWAIVDPRPGE